MSRKKLREKGLILKVVARRTSNSTIRVCMCSTVRVAERKPQHKNKGKILPLPLRGRLKELQGKGRATKGKWKVFSKRNAKIRVAFFKGFANAMKITLVAFL